MLCAVCKHRHLFRAERAFFCEAVGYLAAAGLTHTNAACHHAPSAIYHDMGISTYCTADGYLAFALTDPNMDGDSQNLWYASDIVANGVGGSGNYVARGSLLKITESARWWHHGCPCLALVAPFEHLPRQPVEKPCVHDLRQRS
jgi:hypothetical protein